MAEAFILGSGRTGLNLICLLQVSLSSTSQWLLCCCHLFPLTPLSPFHFSKPSILSFFSQFSHGMDLKLFIIRLAFPWMPSRLLMFFLKYCTQNLTHFSRFVFTRADRSLICCYSPRCSQNTHNHQEACLKRKIKL